MLGGERGDSDEEDGEVMREERVRAVMWIAMKVMRAQSGRRFGQ